jgi:hypothetical protein
MSMRAKLPRPLRVFFHAAPTSEPEDVPPGPATAPRVGLTTYTEDSLAFGYVALTAARVTDLLNEHEEVEFVDAYVLSLEDRHGLALRTIVVARDEILAVGVAGPRGDPARRVRTRSIPIELRIGPYDIWGNIHVMPGTDPLVSFRSRGAVVPLTEATVEWDSDDGHQVAHWGTVVVNRSLTEWIAPARRDVRPPEVELVPEFDGVGLAKNFTPQLRSE